MHQHSTATQTMEISEVKSRLSIVIEQVSRKKARVVVEAHGAPVAAIISVEDLNRFTQLEREREERFSALEELREAFKDAPPEEIEREADRAVDELRGTFA